MKRLRCSFSEPCDECDFCKDDCCLRCGLSRSPCTCELALVPSVKSRNIRGALQSFDSYAVGPESFFLWSTLMPFGVGGYKSVGQAATGYFSPLRGVGSSNRHSNTVFVDGVVLRASCQMANFSGAVGNWFADCMFQILYDNSSGFETGIDAPSYWSQIFSDENTGGCCSQFVRQDVAHRFTSVYRKRFVLGSVGVVPGDVFRPAGSYTGINSFGSSREAGTGIPLENIDTTGYYGFDQPVKLQQAFGIGYPNQISFDEYIKLNGRVSKWSLDDDVVPVKGNYIICCASDIYVEPDSDPADWSAAGCPNLQLSMRWKYFSK